MKKIICFLLIFITSFQLFSQIENSKRKIELLPPLSSTLKNLQINPNNPDYFSISPDFWAAFSTSRNRPV